jgi:hypothetical protein
MIYWMAQPETAALSVTLLATVSSDSDARQSLLSGDDGGAPLMLAFAAAAVDCTLPMEVPGGARGPLDDTSGALRVLSKLLYEDTEQSEQGDATPADTMTQMLTMLGLGGAPPAPRRPVLSQTVRLQIINTPGLTTAARHLVAAPMHNQSGNAAIVIASLVSGADTAAAPGVVPGLLDALRQCAAAAGAARETMQPWSTSRSSKTSPKQCADSPIPRSQSPPGRAAGRAGAAVGGHRGARSRAAGAAGAGRALRGILRVPRGRLSPGRDSRIP